MASIRESVSLNLKAQVMRNRALWFPLIAFIFAGCHKADIAGQPQSASVAPNGKSSAATAQRADVSQIATTTGPLAPGVGTRAENTVRETVEGDVNPFLTDQLRIFVQQQGRLPRTFTEFVRARLDSTPRPPAGKMWAIDSGSSRIKPVNAH